MIAYKFLESQGKAPFSQFVWPLPSGVQPAAWVSIDGPLVPCVRGIHAMRAQHLPFWLSRELWEVELDGAQQELDSLVVAQRGRLLRRVDAWNDQAWQALCEFCRGRVAEHVVRVESEAPSQIERAHYFVRELEAFLAAGAYATAVYVAAVAAHVGSTSPPELAYRAERGEQAQFLAAHLNLTV